MGAQETCKEQVLPVGRKGMTRRCKCCIGCAVVTVVVLAVAIPVGICVVGPWIAQSAIDMSTLHILNSNIYDVADQGENGTQYNKIMIHSPIILGAQLQEQTVTLVADQPDLTALDGFSNGPFGIFTMPKMNVHKGDNTMDWTTPILFNQSTSADGGLRFVFWTFMVEKTKVARINLTSEPKVKSFGLTFSTKMVKQMVCNCAKGDGCIPQKPKLNDSSLALESSAAVGGAVADIFLFCEPVGTDVSNAAQWNSTGFAMDAAMKLSALANRFLA